jgi:hypothetical protein
MSIEWYKRFHGTAFDPKFKAAAIEARSTRVTAVAVWDATLELASEHEDRGSVSNINLSVIAAGLDLVEDEVRRIWDAFIRLGMIVGERVAKWAKRQGAAAKKLAEAVKPGTIRQRRYRARRAVAESEPELPGLNSVTAVTPGVTEGITVTPDSETEQINKNKRGTPLYPPLAGGDDPMGPHLLIDNTGGKDGRGQRRRRGSELPPDWQPDNDDWCFASSRGHDHEWIDRQAELFRAHHRAKGAVAVDWHECWKSWVLRAADFGRSTGVGGFGGYRSDDNDIVAIGRRILARREAALAGRPVSQL